MVKISTTEDTEDTEDRAFSEKGLALGVLRVLCGN
jgi:hypothetical protein